MRAILALAIVVLAAGSLACGSPLSTAEETQTAAAGGVGTAAPTVGDSTPTAARSASIRVLSLNPAPENTSFFSPDGSRIFRLAPGNLAAILMVGNPDGSDLRAVSTGVVEAEWAPDSRTIVATITSAPITERTPLPLYAIAADGTGMQQIGESDFASFFQILRDGRVAFVQSGQLHFFDSASGTDSVVANAPAIAVDDPTNDEPYLVSEDGRFVATVRGRTLSVYDLTTGASETVTQSLDARRWWPYSWAPQGAVLAYADVDEQRVPALQLFDATDGTRTGLTRAPEWGGAFYGMTWSPAGDWIFFVFRPGGTDAENRAVYEAVNVDTLVVTQLFEKGGGLVLQAGGRKLYFSRSDTDVKPGGTWVATLDY